MSHITLNIDLGDIYDELSLFDKQLLSKWLEEDGHPNHEDYPSFIGIDDEDIVNELNVILTNRSSLTNSERTFIKNLAKRL